VNQQVYGPLQHHRPLFRRTFHTVGIATVLLGLATCVEESSGPRFPRPRADVSDAASAAVLVGAGDIGDCTKPWDSVTANLLDDIPGTVFAAGDNAYPSGTSAQSANC